MQLSKILLLTTISTGIVATSIGQTKPKQNAPKSTPATTTVSKTYSIPAVQTPIKMSEIDSVSYAIGVNIAGSFAQQGLENINLDQVKQGMYDQLKSKNPKISPEQCNGIIQQYMSKAYEAKNKGNIEAGTKYLAQNKTKPGVTTLPSGLQYEVLVAGTGAKPLATNKVKVHYHGTLINGEVFDSSVNRGEPATFGVTQVIQGWIEALQLMPVGSKWKLTIPYNLAYGERGTGGQIGPFSTLIFDVELLDIVE